MEGNRWFGWANSAATPSSTPSASSTAVGSTAQLRVASSAPQLIASPTQPNLALTPPVGSQAKLQSGSSSGTFQTGEVVEYYSTTQGKWIFAKVLMVNPNGTYNLDCKPDVPAGKIRKITQQPLGSSSISSVGSAYQVGDVVEYFGASLEKWIPAKVLKVNTDGTWDLDCKPNVRADKIRRPMADAPYSVGDQVEYFGATQNKWIPATVLKVNLDGTFDLDCKPQVLPDKIRRPAESGPVGSGPIGSGPVGSGSIGSRGSLGSDSGKFKVGDIIEYMSPSMGKWIPAKVLSVTPNGTYNLDCKPDVSPNRMRHIGEQNLGSSSLVSISELGDFIYNPGDIVEYFAASQNNWIPAKVLKSNTNGTYDLDCKPNVLPDKIRKPQDLNGASERTKGDMVEYFSATQNKWIPAKVLSICQNGNYNLDCKPDVSPEKVRGVSKPVGSGRLNSVSGGTVFKVGDTVEYFGSTQNKWIQAKVLKVNLDGTYNLDCKPNVPADKMRPVGRPSSARYSLGESVEYFGATQKMWIPAKVTAVNASGTYNLDCKPDVSPESIRRSSIGSGTTGRYGSSVSVEGLGESVQLLRVRHSGDRCSYEVCPEGAAALEQHGARRIAVASICGLQRSGKTFLLNLLSERVQQSKSRVELCSTEGLWLWIPHSKSGDNNPLIVFIDCEGFGGASSDRAQDAQLMTFCGLLSSVLLLNSKGTLDENLFDTLAPICRFGENIEERGNEANRPVLLWVLRDCMFELRDAHDRPMPPDEYLETALHSAPVNADDQECVQSTREVRQSLLKFFRHRSCMNLVQPVHDDSQLQRLDEIPYTGLRNEFRTGVEKLRAQLISTCLANPKAVGGQPLGCFSFVALFRQLVTAVNDNRILSMKGAWETVQHTACGGLADELRTSASKMLHTLAAGQSVPGGAKLPLTDDALYHVLRDNRHALRSQWEERAVGEEVVRKEYWQELKETLAREEMLVRLQNARLADQQLSEALRSWQEWLDSEDDRALASDNEICADLGGMMERMPTVPVARAASAAVMAAARRVSAARTAMHTTVQQHDALQRTAVDWGKQAAEKGGAARSQLDAKRAELAESQTKAREVEQAISALQDQMGATEAELQSAKTQLQAALEEIETARTNEHALKAQYRAAIDNDTSRRSELDQLRATAAKTDAERLAGERCARTSAEVAVTERHRLEEQIAQAKAESQKYTKQLETERKSMEGENEKSRAEHQNRVEEVRRQLEEERKALKGEQEKAQEEHMRLVSEARRQLEEERVAYAGTLDQHKGRLLARERDTGILEGKQQALTAETQALRERLKTLEGQVREAELHLGQQSMETEQIHLDLEKATADVNMVKLSGDEKIQQQKETYEKKMAEIEEALERKQPKCGCSIQ